MAERQTLPPRATSARSSTSPISTGNFDRLRKEYPDGRYESGADIADDEWIRLKLDIDDRRVRVSVNGKEEFAPTDLKAAPEIGGIGLWVGRALRGIFPTYALHLAKTRSVVIGSQAQSSSAKPCHVNDMTAIGAEAS